MASTAQSSLARTHQARVRPMLDLIDGLRNVGIERDMPIPQVAVMGDQSAGKSSVLEGMSGIPFPRGTGLVTRCPTQIIMKKTLTGTDWRGTIGVSKATKGTLVCFREVLARSRMSLNPFN
jgi:interferon-induced GTP-binding protein Mx1